MSSYGLPPKELMLALKGAFSIDQFLETGTYLGGTAAWAAQHFGEVVTIEASEELRQAAIERHGQIPNVRWVPGDTRKVLRGEVERLSGPAVVWLDSHWSGGVTYGEADECPLLVEIETVRASRHEHHLFIDDARLFTAPPPAPHKSEHWPTLSQVVGTLTRGDRPLEVLILEDTLVAVPASAKELVWRYAQNAATDALNRGEERAHNTLVALGKRLLAGGKLSSARRRLRP